MPVRLSWLTVQRAASGFVGTRLCGSDLGKGGRKMSRLMRHVSLRGLYESSASSSPTPPTSYGWQI